MVKKHTKLHYSIDTNLSSHWNRDQTEGTVSVSIRHHRIQASNSLLHPLYFILMKNITIYLDSTNKVEQRYVWHN
jgi:hypothetical protein